MKSELPPPASSSHDRSSLPKHISKRAMASCWSQHWIRAPPLDGGDDEDTDTGTDTTAPDDTNDIASFTSQQITAIHIPSQ